MARFTMTVELCTPTIISTLILLRRDRHGLVDAGKPRIADGVVSLTSEHDRPFNGIRVW